ncbi:hypothetical protein BST83_13370 [Polaribacter filamentus]|uniref:Phage tail tape measure protein n=1 Tax=Polaribacter filamentus TaxID=53483 RepID=A0A2S7KZI1_9FLAO|nr:phage tail tape measure protein [Polaribacter filamentus]PQB08031.1 hypothetical protein BST83_13370 [Polaribacter filamentus]
MAEDIKRKISIFINDKEVIDSLGGVGREIGKINKKLKETSDPAERKKLNAELTNTKKRYAEIKGEINDTNVSLEEAKGHFSNIFAGLLSGDIKQVQSGLQGIKGGLKGITKAALAFIATPIGIFLTALAGIGLAAKQWVDFNLQVFETNKLVKELTNTTGDSVDGIRIRAEVLRDTFEIDINKSIATAKSLVNSFGVSYDEAFNLIEKSAVRGKHKNEEFFASIEEYPIQFKNAGFSATEFINIVNTGIDLSIYKDKLPDALKEFTLAITEQTPAAKEAMSNAFGKKFTDQLFRDIKTGVKSPKEALQSIALEAQNIGLNAQQAQLLTADLFKGAGEDAGGALKIFESVNIALNGQQKPLTENQELTAKQLELNKELSGVYTQLFASSNSTFSNLIAKGKIFATETLLKILKGGVALYNWFVDLNNQSGAFSAILTGMRISATTTFQVLGILLSNAWDGFKSLGDIVAGIFTLDTARIEKGFSKGFEILPNLVKDLKDQVVKDTNEIYDAFQGKNKAKKIDLKDFLADDTKSTSKTTDFSSNKNNLENEKAKIYKKAEEELDKLIAKKTAERENQQIKGLARELATIDSKYAALQEKYIGHADKLKELEVLKDQEKEDLKKAKKAEYLAAANVIEEENRIAKEALKLDREAEKAITDEEKQLLLLGKAKFIADAELQIELDKELAKVEAVEGAEALKDAIRKKYGLKQEVTDNGFDKSKKALKKKEVEWTDMTEQQKFGLIQQGLGQAADAFNKGSDAWKAMKISEALMSTYEGAQSAFTSLSKIPIIGVPLGIAAAIAATKAGLGRVSEIKNTKQEKMPTFFSGGFTGKAEIGSDKDGAITGYVHQNEWVAPEIMTSNPVYAETFRFLEAERQRLKNGYFNGGPTSANTIQEGSPKTLVSESLEENNIMISIYQSINTLNGLLEAGINAKLILPYDKIKDLKEAEDEIAQSENYGKIA